MDEQSESPPDAARVSDMPDEAKSAIVLGERQRARLAVCRRCLSWAGRQCALYDGCCFIRWIEAEENCCPEGRW